VDAFNWIKKLQAVSGKFGVGVNSYPGGSKGFFDDFIRFFNNPRRFTYTPLVLCSGTKPSA
jgi:hypothetical protein